SVEVTGSVVLFFVPVLVPLTFTATVQEPLASRVTPVRLTLDVPAIAVTAPPQALLRPFGLATTRPAGSGSLNATAVSELPPFGFVRANVRMLVPFSGML